LGSDENEVAGFARPHSVRKTASLSLCLSEAASVAKQNASAESLYAFFLFAFIPLLVEKGCP
jgi:hypothetical protein